MILQTIELAPRTVADFYRELFARLRTLDLDITIRTTPNEIPDAIPFEQDRVHATYDAEQVTTADPASLIAADDLERVLAAGRELRAEPGATQAIEAVMPGGSARFEPFFRYLPNLSTVEKAAAVHLGIFPQDASARVASSSARSAFERVAHGGGSKARRGPVTGISWRARHDSNVRPLPSEGSTLIQLSYGRVCL